MARGAAAPARRARPTGPDPGHAPARTPKRTARRRLSGPTPSRRDRAAEEEARKHAAATRPAPARKPKSPARKPGTARKPATAREPAPARKPAALRPAPASAPLPLRVIRAPFVRALRTRAGGVLDALLYGQEWIALVGVLLAGIVFFNVDLLQLNRQIAGTSERVARLKRANAHLRLDLARLGSSERIQTAAAAEGLVLPAPGDVRYLRVNPAVDARRAAKRIVPPDSSLVAMQPSEPVPAPAATAPAAPTTPADPTQAASGDPAQAAPAGTTQTAPAGTTQPTPGATATAPQTTTQQTTAPQATAGTNGAPAG